MPICEIESAPRSTAPGPAKSGAVLIPNWFVHPTIQTCSLALLIVLGCLRVISTYCVFNHTIDEPSHIAGGIEWWEKGTYTLETKHTPLARISVALGPYLAGVRGIGASRWEDTYPILSQNGHYWRNLILGRIAILPYFLIATLVVFFWTRQLLGPSVALVAAAIFTQLPTILAHSSNATTDMPLTAVFCWALYRFSLWLREPNPSNAAQFGAAAGLSLSTKLSTVIFLPACALPILLMYTAAKQAQWRRLARTLLVVSACAFLSLWGIYRFSHTSLAQVTHFPDRVASESFGPTSSLTALVHQAAARLPVPAPEFFDGIRMLRNQNAQGTKAYLFGRVKEGGWWYFFFAAVALKTPIAVLFLVGVGSVELVRRYWRDRDWEIAAPLAAALMIMLASTPARLDSGVRYVLPVFVFMSMLAAIGVTTLWEHHSQRLLSRSAALLLLAWLAISSAWSHPDYLAYFNEFGGHDPSHLIVVGDLDWGQDFTRLSRYLREHSIQHVSIAADTYFVPGSLDLPATDFIECHGPKPSGWVVVELRRERLHSQCYPWLAGQHAVDRVGKSLTTYYVP
ncbi:MAG: glycosyltransferase family 39 protein [Acidobacteria bacterium]|nr:glycosyltransferase family 39 protein [Acidobacteriota bacterium]